MYPDSIDATNFRYIKVDNKYIVSLSIKSFPDKIYFLDVINCIDKNVTYDMSIYYQKLDTSKVLNDITYNIANMQSELSTINRNQKNVDVVEKSSQDAQKLRKKIQLENQELYIINIVISFYSDNFNQLQKNLASFKAKLYSKRINSDITNFRHLQFFLSNLPLNLKTEYQNKIYITTDALANIFPFYNHNIINTNSIVFGYTMQENKICIIDIFSNKYENSNMCIFGTSGSGKSYFVKLLVLRNFFQGKRQIIFDIESEYENICKKLNGKIINNNTYFNILQICEKDILEENYLENKIERVVEVISILCNTEGIKISMLKDEIRTLYQKYRINNDIRSVMCSIEEGKVYLDNKIINKEKFPTLIDLKNNVKDKELKQFLDEQIKGVLNFFSRVTSYEDNENLYVISVSKIYKWKEVLPIILKYILDKFLDKHETIIYIDELWKYMINENITNDIVNMYKSIRKRNASIITITQDITDFFKYENGNYAKSILNNSCFKLIFKTEYKDEEIFNKLIDIDNNKIASLKIGETYLLIGKNKLLLKVKSNKFEGEIIDEDDSGFK